MLVIDRFTASRSAGRESEDMIQVTQDYAVVVDGAGDPGKRHWRNHSLGWHAASTLCDEIARLDPVLAPDEIVRRLTARLAELSSELTADGYGNPPPAANIVLFSRARREIIRVGDCNFAIDGRVNGPPPKAFEQVLIDVRQLILRSGLSAGKPVAQLDDDVDRVKAILYNYQELCQNSSHRFSFAVLDGNYVRPQGIEVVSLGPGGHEIVLTSDGYPVVLATLRETELALSKILDSDPLLIGEYPQTRARSADGSFDDRSYLRIAVAA
jgi:hypothetical protein